MEALKNAEVVKAMKSGSEKEMLEAFMKNGINVSAEELKGMFTVKKELSEEELESVAGGNPDNACGTAAAIPCVVFIVTAFAAFV